MQNQRVIKFRIWQKESKTWRGFNHPKGKCAHIACMKLEDGIWEIPPNNNWVFQQFAGLLDKNGKEIYEGDIVKQTMEKGTNLPERFKDYILRDNEKTYIGEVKWSNYGDGEYVDNIECFMLGDRCSLSELISRTMGAYHEWVYTYEIIGNIFENPELLK